MTDQLSEAREADLADVADQADLSGSGQPGVSDKALRQALANAEAAEEAKRAFYEGRIAARGRALERAHSLGQVPLRDPAARSGILEVFQHQHLMSLMVKRELRQRYLGSKMGLAWSYINPTVRFATFYFVFGILLNRGTVPHFAIHLFAGMVIINYFNDTFAAGSRSIIGNKGMINKMPLPRQLYPVASMLVSLYHTGPQLVVLVLACLGTGSFTKTPVTVIAMLMSFAIIILMATAMGVVFSAVSVLYRDFTRVVQIFTNMLPFAVPMMYSYSLVTTRVGTGIWHTLYMQNPAVYAVLLMQRAFWFPTISPADIKANPGFNPSLNANFPPHLFTHGLEMIGICFVLLIVASAIFNRLDDKLPDRMST